MLATAATIFRYVRTAKDDRPPNATDMKHSGKPRAAGVAPPSGGGAISQDARTEQSSSPEDGKDLTGEWVGTYGPLGQQATLVIQEGEGGRLSGTLEQGGVRVAFVGSVNFSTRQVSIKETRVLSGSEWSLGENAGSLSADGREMSGTGGDAVGAQLGMKYQWSFSRR
jgi:hypothetical protein